MKLDSSEILKKPILPNSYPMNLVAESGLYKLLMRSDKPQAKPFQDWVTKVVLPAIRKDGGYVMGSEKIATVAEQQAPAKQLSVAEMTS